MAFVIGREAFAKICSVEGIYMTTDMESDFKEYDKKKLSNDERRRLIKQKYLSKLRK